MLSTEQSPKSSRERWPFIVSGIGMQDKSSLWRRQGDCLFVCKCAAHQCRRDVRYLVSVNETHPMSCRHRYAVKEVQLRNLQDMLDLAELGSGRAKDRRTNSQCHIRDGLTFVHGLLPSAWLGL